MLTVAVIGIITAAAGRIMGDVGRYGYWLVALVFILAVAAFLNALNDIYNTLPMADGSVA